MLPDPHHERIFIYGSPQARPTVMLSMDLGRHRIKPHSIGR